jgi:hypothetical protein
LSNKVAGFSRRGRDLKPDAVAVVIDKKGGFQLLHHGVRLTTAFMISFLLRCVTLQPKGPPFNLQSF